LKILANSWNKDIKTGKGCIGCGPQETFYGCSDISIEPTHSSNLNSNTNKKSTKKLNFLITKSSKKFIKH
jgi:hypothetical protein